MAKSKETNIPLIFALVFFVLTTIAFGVMWYLSFSEMETHIAAKKAAEKDAKDVSNQKAESERLARVYRIYLGIPDPEDVNTIDTESKPNDKIAAEVKKINDAMAKQINLADAAAAPEELKFWQIDAGGKANKSPTEGLVHQIAKFKNKDVAYAAADKERDSYKTQVTAMTKAVTDLKAEVDKFSAETKALPGKVTKGINDAIAGFDNRTALYVQDRARDEKIIADVKEERDRAKRELVKEKEKVATLTETNQTLTDKSRAGEQQTFSYDEPQGKILRKVPGTDGVVEISLGSSSGVRPGLTFTVLPTDFPEKGRQSRVRMLRVPDGKGAYKSVETFVPKGSIEVFEVVNERLSLARITAGSELDPIRDGVAQGDLIYNSVWRKGVADHIALVGIFDVNGDGSDDIETVVKDLLKMGIPVDAYFDMKKRAWVGQVTERTRYIVEGYFPLNSLNDPNRDEKTELLVAMGKAVTEGKQKGVNTVNFRDFFSRMGYKFRLDVTDDKVNQATAPYLKNVAVGGGAVPPPPPPP